MLTPVAPCRCSAQLDGPRPGASTKPRMGRSGYRNEAAGDITAAARARAHAAGSDDRHDDHVRWLAGLAGPDRHLRLCSATCVEGSDLQATMAEGPAGD